jgi:Ribbon-helix-helix protein, copG family
MQVKTSTKKKSLVLKLSDQEMEALTLLAERRGTTKTGLLRQALRLYQSVDERMRQGERLYLEDSSNKEKMELVLL